MKPRQLISSLHDSSPPSIAKATSTKYSSIMYKALIRKATTNDLDILLRFEQGVINAERHFDPTLKGEPTRYYDLQEMISAPHIELLVAEVNGELVGSGYARIESSKPYLQHSKHAYLGFMYVEPAHRGKGINALIIQALEKWILLKGLNEVRLDVYHLNESAIKAYEKAGFSRHMIEMRKEIKT
jgi:RimJ/RimL family protein N-acetyltransferase